MEIREIRRWNLHLLVEQFACGNATQYCEQFQLSYKPIQQVLSGAKKMGDRMARQGEERHGLETGWMDVSHSDEPKDSVPGGRSESALRLAQQIEKLPAEDRELLERLVEKLLAPEKKKKANRK